MSGFLNLQKVFVSQKILLEGQDFLRKVGETGREGMVLWVGKHEELTFTVTNLVIPKQKGLITADGVCVIIEPDELRILNLELYRHDLRLIAQLHTHPGRAYHSQTDDEYAIARTIGAFSLVIPNFAVRPFALNECATYCLSAKGSWDQLSPAKVNQLIQIKE